jgi:hypothetical protein
MASGNFLLEQLLAFSKAGNGGMPLTKEQTSIKTTVALRGEPGQRFHLLKCITERRENGDSFYSIAASLNEQGLRGRNGARWYSASVREYLRRHS